MLPVLHGAMPFLIRWEYGGVYENCITGKRRSDTRMSGGMAGIRHFLHLTLTVRVIYRNVCSQAGRRCTAIQIGSGDGGCKEEHGASVGRLPIQCGGIWRARKRG